MPEQISNDKEPHRHKLKKKADGHLVRKNKSPEKFTMLSTLFS